jgi:hypothetical protein
MTSKKKKNWSKYSTTGTLHDAIGMKRMVEKSRWQER